MNYGTISSTSSVSVSANVPLDDSRTKFNRGNDRTINLLQGECVLDVQFQTRLLGDESDKTTQDALEIKKNGHSPLGASQGISSKSIPLGIGILTNLRVLVLYVSDPSTSPLVITNQHTHSTCDDNENENSYENGNRNDVDDDYVRANKGDFLN